MLRLLIEKVLEAQLLTPLLETQINRRVWQRNFEPGDLEALNQLMDAIETGKVRYQK